MVTTAESITDLITGRRKPSVSAGVTVFTSLTRSACVTVSSRPPLCACVAFVSGPPFLTLYRNTNKVVENIISRFLVRYILLWQETTLVSILVINDCHSIALQREPHLILNPLNLSGTKPLQLVQLIDLFST